ncbi:MAG: sulfatase family protein [Verrucomicrobiia bacterium]
MNTHPFPALLCVLGVLGIHTATAAPKGPNIAKTPLTITLQATPHPTSSDGVLAAHGGIRNGYSLFVEDGRLKFTIRRNDQPQTISSKLRAPAKPFIAEARLNAKGGMLLLLNRKEVAEGSAGGLIPRNPGEGPSVGQDPGTPVGEYQTPFRYRGEIAEVVFNGKSSPGTVPIKLPPPRMSQSKLPNIVVVIGDDHGVYHSNPYGADWLQTPNMQALADEGMTFHRAYVASPACAPSRAALMTGLMPYRNGIVGNHERELKPGVQSLLPRLNKLGYDIICLGKVFHGNARAPYYTKGVRLIPGAAKPLDVSGAEAFLANREDITRPVLAFIGCKWPHRPWPEPKDARIQPDKIKVPERTFDTPETRSEMTRYVEAVEGVDRTLGLMRAMVKKYLGDENTVMLYTADHGHAWPFGKWSLYETGIRTPLLVKWPGKIVAGSSTDAMVSWIDLIPTFIDIAGGKKPPGIDGRSIKSVLFGKTNEHRDRIFATHKGDKQMNVYPIRSLRIGDWKYIRNLRPDLYYTTHMDLVTPESPYHNRNWPSWIEAAKTSKEAAAFLRAYHSRPAEELYNVAEDPFEKRNLAASSDHYAQLKELRDLVARRMKQIGDDESLSGNPRFLKEFELP